jgi:hypothetical protein
VDRNVAEKSRRDQREQILRRKAERRREDEGQRSIAHGFRSRLPGRAELHRGEQNRAERNDEQPGRGAQAGRARLGQPAGAIDRGNQSGVVDVLRLAGQDLQGEGEHAEQAPGAPAGVEPAVDGDEDERHPRHRGEVGEQARLDAEEIRRGEDEQRRGDEPGERREPAPRRPQVEKRPQQPGVERDAPVDGERQRQHQEQPVRRVKQRRLHAAEERLAAEDVRIPQREVAFRQLAETELPPRQGVRRQVVGRIAEHARTGREQKLAEHGEQQQGERRERGGMGVTEGHRAAARLRRRRADGAG